MEILNQNSRLAPGTVAATIGMFDGVHLGHLTLIGALKREAAQRGLKTCVVTFAHHPQVVLRPGSDLKMLMTVDDKLAEIERQGVDYVVLLDFTERLSRYSSRQFIQLLRDRFGMAVLVAGYDHHFGHDVGEDFGHYVSIGRSLGIDIVKAPEYLGTHAPVSSSIIRRLIASGKVDDAMRCMGRPFKIKGTVVQGFHNGRRIGFPTANLGMLNPNLILPHNGAYAVWVNLGGQRLQGMVNVGRRPTLDNGSQLSVEVNIFDFDRDIYGEVVELEFIKFLRLEFKLGSVEELRAQLTRDRDRSRAILSQA